MAKTNKFTKNISQNSSVLTDRAVIVAGQAKRAQEDLVRSIEGRIDDMKMNIIKMTVAILYSSVEFPDGSKWK